MGTEAFYSRNANNPTVSVFCFLLIIYITYSESFRINGLRYSAFSCSVRLKSLRPHSCTLEVYNHPIDIHMDVDNRKEYGIVHP